MEGFLLGQRDEITRLEGEISTLTHDAGDDPEGLRAQILQLRTERNDFERHTVSTREDLLYTEADLDRLHREAAHSSDEIGDMQEHVRVFEHENNDARSESTTALASYDRNSSSLTNPQPDRGGSPLGGMTRLVQAHQDHVLADFALTRATLPHVTSDRDRALRQLAQTTEDRDRALVDRDWALQLRNQAAP
ncbi:hypothetical protein PHMEG_0009772 [Phytophthora megakarya]|uniref:Uncharacterized protein n=1 Tax=Phytophthora megakarya TaxID=4795 RepID=A0A225WFN3_9STRA|nr:hypothetical protein PHMEG_0009772 [Phytophthora megakarya]